MRISIFTRRFISVFLSICLLMTTVFVVGYRETVSAATTDVLITVGTGQTWTSPNTANGPPRGTFTSIAPGYGSYYYSVYRFTVSTTSDYSITSSNPTGTLHDAMFYLYTGSFNAASPVSPSFTIGNNDSSATLNPAIVSVPLTAGTIYYLVTTSSSTDRTGSLNVQFYENTSGTAVSEFYTVSYTAAANGIISGSTPQNVPTGGNGTPVTAVPDAGYHFTNWSDGALAATRSETNVTSDISLAASFAINTYALSYTAGANGSISGITPQTVNHGSNGTPVTAVPDAGYHFAGWSDGVSTAARTDLAVTKDTTVTASFAINSYTLTYAAAANGTLSGSAAQTVNYGSDGIAVTAIPATGYHFTGWSDGVLTAARSDLSVKADLAVTADFAINSYTVIFQSWDGSVLSEQIVVYGMDATSPANPVRSGYTFVSWSLPFTDVTGNIISVAVYTQNPAPTATPTATPTPTSTPTSTPTPTPATVVLAADTSTPAPTAVPAADLLGAAKTGEADNQNIITAAFILLAALGVGGTVFVLRRKKTQD